NPARVSPAGLCGSATFSFATGRYRRATPILARLCVRRLELLLFGRTGQRRRGGLITLDRLRNSVEVTCAHLALVLHSSEAQVGSSEFLLLQFHERAHLTAGITMGQFEHAVVQGVEAGQRDELETIAHGAEFTLELGDGVVVQVLLPVERRRAVVCQHLARELAMNRLGE